MKNQEALNREHIEILNRQIEHIESHLEQSGYKCSAFSSMVISSNWSTVERRSIEDVLDKYDRAIEKGETPSMDDFESELERLMDTDYSTVKAIVGALSAEGRFAYVCREYAKHLNNADTQSILDDLEKNRCF